MFQYWKEEVPWAVRGEVTVANVGELAKEAGIFPGQAAAPGPPPGTPRAITPPSNTIPVRGFGLVWREGTGVKVRERLGWAVEPERGGGGSWQLFQQGRMVWTPDPQQIVFALAERREKYQPLNVRRSYADKFSS